MDTKSLKGISITIDHYVCSYCKDPRKKLGIELFSIKGKKVFCRDCVKKLHMKGLGIYED